MPPKDDREFLSLAGAAGLGAAAMYFFDPARGRRRRHMIADKVVHTEHVVGEGARIAKRDLRNRAVGAAAKARRRLAGDQADDQVVAERLRAELGRVVSHPRAIDVSVTDGRATLSGLVLADEADGLLHRARSVRGVNEVEDRLERHETVEDIPELQGAGRPVASRLERFRDHWSPTARLLTSVTGGALVLGATGGLTRGLTGRGRFGPARGILGLAGLALLARGIVNEPLRKLTGLGAGRDAVRVRRSVDIAAPADVVFDYVTDWERWPEWMPNVHEVTRSGSDDGDADERTHWEVEGPGGTGVTWDAVTTRFVENECVSWKSDEGAAIQHAGTLQLVPTGDDSTRVHIDLSYDPTVGAIGDLIAETFGSDPARQARVALERLKSVIETGVIPHHATSGTRGRRVWSGPRKWEDSFR